MSSSGPMRDFAASPRVRHQPMFSIWLGALTSAALVACGARSDLASEAAGSGGADSNSAAVSSSSGHGGDGGSVPFACGPGLAVMPPVAVDIDSTGSPEHVIAAFGTNNGQVVSLFHERPGDPGNEGLLVSTLEPWEAWPPRAGQRFTFDEAAGKGFALANVGYGQVSVAYPRIDAESEGALYFTAGMSPTSPGGLALFQLATPDASPVATFVTQGYSTPPVAQNLGYLSSLAGWDEIDADGTHALRAAVASNGVGVLAGMTTHPDDPDLACADAPIAADALRVGQAWWVISASGSSLVRCGDEPAGAPTALVVDALEWGPPDTVTWSLDRIATVDGSAPIAAIHALPTEDGAWVMVRRKGASSLEMFRFVGGSSPKTTTEIAADSEVVTEALATLENGFVVAYVGVSKPTLIRLELHDGTGALRGSDSIVASSPVTSLSMLASKAGDAAVVAFTTAVTDDQVARLEIARVGCEAPGT